MLGLRFCVRAFSSCGKRGPLFIAVHGPLTIAASLVAEHRLQTRRLSSCGSRAQLFHGMWNLPRPGLEPMSPALAGRFSTIAPPGKPPEGLFLNSGPQSPGHELVLVWGLLGNGLHSRKWAEGEQAKLHLLLPIAFISAWTIPPPPAPSPWKNCLPQNWSLVPKMLGTTDLKYYPTGEFIGISCVV